MGPGGKKMGLKRHSGPPELGGKKKKLHQGGQKKKKWVTKGVMQ